ncbi:unnamed protein product [Phytophthora lilii]|uniref:Unnamed protein product n=1 Tax=Phytophthora lilii TaxID=2077276 RepID=A0A9W6XA69_9STRA|nr:unnamed protein product [Phytophthora lilii]
MQAWNTLREYYNRTTLHNRVMMTLRLHEFKKEDGSTMSKHLDAFDELVVGLQTLGEQVDEARQLVVLLSSMPSEYELITSIVENAKDVTLNDVKEKLLVEYERLEKKETTERAFKANAGRFKGGQRNGRKGNGPRKNGSRFKGKCFKCNQTGHMKRDCPNRNGDHDEEAVFAVTTTTTSPRGSAVLDQPEGSGTIPRRVVVADPFDLEFANSSSKSKREFSVISGAKRVFGRSPYSFMAKYSAEVAQLNRLLQSSATPVSPSAQPAGASHGSQRSPSSRPTSPGKRPLSKSSAAGLSLAAAGLGSSSSDSEDFIPRKPSAKRHRLSQGKPSHPLGSRLVLRPEASAASPTAAFCRPSLLLGSQSPASASHAPLALAQQSSAPSGAATPSPPGPRAASPAAPEVVDLSGDDQVDEAPASVDTSHEISLSTPKRRDGRPTREASVTASLRSKASLEELLASDDLVLDSQSPSDDADGPPSPPSGAAGTPSPPGPASQVPVVSSSGTLTSQASVVISSVSSPVQASAAPSSPPPLPPASVPAPTDVSVGVLTGNHGHGLDHAGHQPERVYACDVASATSGVESFDAAANLG